jgi:hypothetical protein
MKGKEVFLKVDSRNRISLTKVVKDLPVIFKAYVKDGKIILEPVQQVPEEEAWLFKPENKEVLKRLKESLDQEANIDLGSFSKYVE